MTTPSPEDLTQPKTKTLKLQHSSLCVFNTPAQKNSDARKVFTTNADIITGTESGGAIGYLKKHGKAAGYKVFALRRTDSWIAIKKDLKVRRTGMDFWYKELIPRAKASGDPNGPYAAKGIFQVTFQAKDFGEVSVGASHFLTKGRFRHQTPKGQFNHYDMNVKFCAAIGEWAQKAGKGPALVFHGSDTNIPDDKQDVFRGQPFTTCWDEAGKWPDTGHGPIDVIASYNQDKRVKLKSCRVLSLGLHSDHKSIEAIYEVKLRP